MTVNQIDPFANNLGFSAAFGTPTYPVGEESLTTKARLGASALKLSSPIRLPRHLGSPQDLLLFFCNKLTWPPLGSKTETRALARTYFV